MNVDAGTLLRALRKGGFNVEKIRVVDAADPSTWIVKTTDNRDDEAATFAATLTEDDVEAAAVRYIDVRELMRRLTALEHYAIEALALADATGQVRKLWNTLKAGDALVDINGEEFRAGVAFFLAAAVPAVWPDVETATTRFAQVIA